MKSVSRFFVEVRELMNIIKEHDYRISVIEEILEGYAHSGISVSVCRKMGLLWEGEYMGSRNVFRQSGIKY